MDAWLIVVLVIVALLLGVFFGSIATMSGYRQASQEMNEAMQPAFQTVDKLLDRSAHEGHHHEVFVKKLTREQAEQIMNGDAGNKETVNPEDYPDWMKKMIKDMEGEL